MIILDIMKVLYDPFFQVPEYEKLGEFPKKTEKQFGDKTVFIIADMSMFRRLRRGSNC